ncbi:MAG: hypothetical protein R3C44_08670 [Chloroflexota bacterium]
MTRNGPRLRHRIEHVKFFTPVIYRLAQLGVIASMQPILPQPTCTWLIAIGETAAHFSYAFRYAGKWRARCVRL